MLNLRMTGGWHTDSHNSFNRTPELTAVEQVSILLCSFQQSMEARALERATFLETRTPAQTADEAN